MSGFRHFAPAAFRLFNLPPSSPPPLFSGKSAAFRRSSAGNTLAFVLIFLTILSFLMVPIINIFTYSSMTAVKSKNALIALNLALQTIEEIKAKHFDDVVSMLPSDRKPFEGDWIDDASGSVKYPEYYKMFRKNIEVKTDKDFSPANKKLKRIVVTVFWDELNDERRRLTHAIKLATCISAE